MFSKLWTFLGKPKNRSIIAWLGGPAVVVGGIWTVVTFVVDHRDAHEKAGTPVTLSGQGIASSGSFSVGGNLSVTTGASKEQIEQIQKPLTDQLSAKDAQIAALTKMLLERNPASGPGAQLAVGEAVASIAAGAAEGDARLQQALDLLKANKTAEASQLLSAFARDKKAHAEQAAAQAQQATAQAEKDRKDAATAYRNLGAIADSPIPSGL